MTLPLSLWILERLVSLGFAAAPAPVCQIPASEWMNEPAVGEGFAGKSALPLESGLEKELQTFFTHFDTLYSQRTDRATKDAQGAMKAWVEKLPLAYEREALEPLAKALRRWTGLYLRDSVSQMDAAMKRTAADKFKFAEKLFAGQPPPLTLSFCLDEELSTGAEDAKKTRQELLALKAQRDDLTEFSEELEKQYLQRIRENPASPDRILPYAYFLFSVGRLDEAAEQVRQAKALAPKLAGLNELTEAMTKVQAMENPLDRWRFIRAFTSSRRLAEEAKFKSSQRPPPPPRAPLNKKVPSAPKAGDSRRSP